MRIITKVKLRLFLLSREKNIPFNEINKLLKEEFIMEKMTMLLPAAIAPLVFVVILLKEIKKNNKKK